MAKKNIEKNSKRSKAWLLLALALVVLTFIISVRYIPIERMRYSGGCRSEDNRLSLIFDGQAKVDDARKEVEKMNLDRQERRQKYPGLSDGCGTGLSYVIYIF